LEEWKVKGGRYEEGMKIEQRMRTREYKREQRKGYVCLITQTSARDINQN
jgi:hypothetical protein